MNKELDIALSAKINSFKEKFNLDGNSLDLSVIFEKFCNYVIISNELEEEIEELNKLSTGMAQGIDGIAIIVNDKLIADESDLERIGKDEEIKIKLVFVQSTLEISFDSKKFGNFVDKVVDFLTGNFSIEPFSSIYSKLLSEESNYIDNLKETPRVVLYYLSGKTEHNIDQQFMSSQFDKVIHREELRNKVLLDSIRFLQKDEIKDLYDKIPSFQEIQVNFSGYVQIREKEKIQMSLLSYIKFDELKRLILTKDETLKENLFVENPRSFLGQTSVNQDIENTLRDDRFKNFFVFLNNGITLLCNRIQRHPTVDGRFILTYPRIINGCQTVHVLYEVYKVTPDRLSDIELTVKVIATEDEELKNKIIFAANNQNSISDDLRALNEYHKKIEEFFKGFNKNNFGLCYERLRGQYPSINPPYRKINIENLAKVYISIFLQEPHKMKSNALSKIDEYQRKKKVFDPTDDDISKYYYCALLYYWLNKFLSNNEIRLESKTMDMHLLLVCDLIVVKGLEQRGMPKDNDTKIQLFSNEVTAKKIFEISITFITRQTYLFERRGFYSGPKTQKMVEQLKQETLQIDF
ncbi:MAG: AIPR family protein [Candidatus Aenigmatarchaeota archaeon]